MSVPATNHWVDRQPYNWNPVRPIKNTPFLIIPFGYIIIKIKIPEETTQNWPQLALMCSNGTQMGPNSPQEGLKRLRGVLQRGFL